MEFELHPREVEHNRVERKLPSRMKKVYQEIFHHPLYPSLSEGTKWGLQAAVHGWSWCTKENNKWAREIWKHVHSFRPEVPEELPEEGWAKD